MGVWQGEEEEEEEAKGGNLYLVGGRKPLGWVICH